MTQVNDVKCQPGTAERGRGQVGVGDILLQGGRLVKPIPYQRMAIANLNKSEELVINTTAASKYIHIT